jgi:hypothetical protein
MENWVQFNVLELIDREKWPRVPMRRFLEINPLGEVRYLDKSGPKPEYKLIQPAVYGCKAYIMLIVGRHHGHMVTERFLQRDLVKRFFN